MIEVSNDKILELNQLFQTATDSTIYSVLEGRMGRAFADCETNPQYALLYIGDFLFLSNRVGNFDKKVAQEMLTSFAKIRALTEIFMVPQTKEWEECLKVQYKERERYRLKEMRPEDVDVQRLSNLVSQLPKGYHLKKFDEELCKQAMSMDWSKDFCVNFKDMNEYLHHGVGIGILYNGQLVCGASSYSYYSRGIEVEIATKAEFRRKGLATICGAALLLECKKQNQWIHWDAANKMSVAIAEKLGYEYLLAYSCYQKE